jgi:hypothetical protein
MVQCLKQLGDFSRVTADTQPNIIIAGEDIIQDFLAALKLMFARLTLHTRPKRILKRKSLLEFDLGCEAFDISLVTSVITSSNGDSLAEKFLDNRDEGLVLGELDTIEGVVRCLHTAGERGGVVTLKERHAL